MPVASPVALTIDRKEKARPWDWGGPQDFNCREDGLALGGYGSFILFFRTYPDYAINR